MGFDYRWGYFYESNYTNGSLDQYQDMWSILGMDYTASDDSWAAVKSYNKKVCAHILPSLTAYNTALAKGADMGQAAALATVPEVNMAITIENIQTPEMSATPLVTIAVPANAQTGDYLVVMYRCQINLSYLMAMTFGDAFTLVTGTGPNASGTADKRHTGIYIRKLDMSVEPSGYTFRPTQYASNTRASAVALLLRGVDQMNPVMDSPTVYGGTTSSTAHSTVESLTADGEALLVYMGAAELVANIAHVPTETPSGVTLQGMVPGETESAANSRTYVWGGTKNIASSGETGELTIGWASTTTQTSTANAPQQQ